MSVQNKTATPQKQAPRGFGSPASGGSLVPSPAGSGKPTVGQKGSNRLIQLQTLKGQFNILVLLCTILSAVGLIASFLVLDSVETNFNDIINNSAPSIIAAQKLGLAIQDADAKAADYQLYSRIDVTSPDFNPKVYGDNGLRNQAWNAFLQRRKEVNDKLFTARSNITYPGEADAINAITDRFLDYFGRINVMRYELDQGHREAALAAFKSAHDLLVGNLNNVPLDDKGRSPEEQAKLNGWTNFDTQKPYLGIEANVQKLSQINATELNKASNAATNSIAAYTLVITVLTILLVLGLAFLCFRHAVVTHRIINPGYALAFLGALVLSVVLITNLQQATQDYTTVSKDSFLSIDTAARTRQLASDANADESRLLLSPESPGLDSTNLVLTADVRKAFNSDLLTENFNKKEALIKDQLATAWKNITYSGEQVALCKITQNVTGKNGSCSGNTFALDSYLKVDTDIRTAFKNNLLAEAISLNTGKSNDFFGQFDTALAELSTVNEQSFDKSACQAIGKTQFGGACNNEGYAPFLKIFVLVAFPLIALSVIGGFWYVRREF
ncbi:MAG: hypothetical protein WCS37_11460 [Chloroflexota bacterium]|nr:hypothetical protein [Chloroflexota bacterium]